MDLDTDRSADAELAAHRAHVPDVADCVACQDEHQTNQHPDALAQCAVCVATHAAECETMPDLCLWCNPRCEIGSLLDGKDPA